MWFCAAPATKLCLSDAFLAAQFSLGRKHFFLAFPTFNAAYMQPCRKNGKERTDEGIDEEGSQQTSPEQIDCCNRCGGATGRTYAK